MSIKVLENHLNLKPPLLFLKRSLFKVEVMKVIDEERISDGFEDHPDVVRVRGTGEVCVKGFMALPVLLLVHF